jgi:general secretion pathway protein D
MPSPDAYLQDEWAGLTLQEQKKVFLVQSHLEKARDLRSRLMLEDAEREVAKALELDPDNLEAKRLLDEVGALLGRQDAELRTGTQRLEELHGLKRDQAEADARQNLAKAKVLQARGDYDAAIVELTLCIDIVTLSPYSGEWQDVESEARALLDAVRAQRDQAATVRREEAQREARSQLKEEEDSQRQQREAVLNNLLDDAIKAFNRNDFEEASELADRVLRLDPRNEMALDIRDTSFRKGRDLVREDALRKKREQYARWEEELEELRIPYQGIITLPDIDYWNEITELRKHRPGIDLAQTVDPGELELRTRLAETLIPGLTVDNEESLSAVVRAVQVITGLPIVVDPLAEDAALTEGVVFDFNLTNSLTAERALNLITQMGGPDVTWTVRHETVLVTTVEKARGDLVIYNHDVQDLTFGLTDFLGPRIDRLRLIDDLEDEDGGSPFGAISEKPKINEPDDLATLLQDNVAVGSWEDDGISITVEGGNMVVVHTPEVQIKVRQFLEDLRRFSSSLVTIESKFLVIKDGFIQEIGVDWRGIDNPGNPYKDLDDVRLSDNPTLGLDNSGDGVTLTPPSSGAFYDDGEDGSYAGRTENIFDTALGGALSTIGGLTAQYTFLNDLELSMVLRLVEKSAKAELINDQVLSVHNTQRAYVTVVNQRAYVQDFDVEVAQFQAIADPVINVLTEGIVLDVRPTIHHSRRYLTLEIQPTVANVVSLTDFSTTLAGQTAAVTFQLPELQVQSVFTTAVVPDGGSILLGGLSRMRNVERRAEVPWLANIPLLGFFFKEEGYNDERESLMIMLRAWITDVKEELASAEAR